MLLLAGFALLALATLVPLVLRLAQRRSCGLEIRHAVAQFVLQFLNIWMSVVAGRDNHGFGLIPMLLFVWPTVIIISIGMWFLYGVASKRRGAFFRPHDQIGVYGG